MASSIVNSSQISFLTFCEKSKFGAHLEVHFEGLWAPGLLTMLLQGGLKLESYVAESYVNFGSILGHLGGTPPPWEARADRDSYLQAINRDYRLQTEPCLTRLVTPDGVGGFLISRLTNGIMQHCKD